MDQMTQNESTLNNTSSTVDAPSDEMQQFCASGKSVMDLAHLVKNMIQMVSGSVEIMELGLERKQYDRVSKSWDIFQPNLIRLKKFVLDLINFTKQYPLQRTDCDFNQTVTKGIKSCEYILKNKQVKIQFTPDKNIPVAQLDCTRIEELTANLITHSLDNLPDHAGKITVQTQYLADCQQIQLSVSDDGPALSKADQQALAQPLERTRNMCGAGFDIPLATLFAQQHEGYLEIDASEDKGNTVCVYLPFKQ